MNIELWQPRSEHKAIIEQTPYGYYLTVDIAPDVKAKFIPQYLYFGVYESLEEAKKAFESYISEE